MNKHLKRWTIHILILLGIILLISFAFYVNQPSGATTNFLPLLLQSSIGILVIMVPTIYINVYWLIPRYLVQKKYFPFAVGIVLLAFVWIPLSSSFENWADAHWFGMPPVPDEYWKALPVGVFLLLLSTLINLSYRWFIQKSKIKQIENDRLTIELSMLKNQINPHFFFNTLNNLYALSLENSDKTPEIILKLSEMMRYAIYDCKHEEVAIPWEIAYLENYIALQSIRHFKRGEITFQQEVKAPNFRIAPMILIVFLENAFKHGFESIDKGAYININLLVTEKELHFTIENNFRVMDESDSDHLGLDNVRRRLTLIYPEQHSLVTKSNGKSFTADLKIRK